MERRVTNEAVNLIMEHAPPSIVCSEDSNSKSTKMLPPSLFSAYRQYKQDTDAIASWLAVTAKAHRYPADLFSNHTPSQPTKSGRLKGKAQQAANEPKLAPKYTVAIRDFIPWPNGFPLVGPTVAVPSAFAIVIDRVIKVRSRFAVDYGLKAGGESDQRHSYFLGVLEKVRQLSSQECQQSSPNLLPDNLTSLTSLSVSLTYLLA